MELRIVKLHHAADYLVQIDSFEAWRGHFCKIAESSDDSLQIRYFGQQRRGAFREHLVELVRWKLARALHVLDGDLEREERIFQLMGQTPGQLAPSGDAFGLNGAVALLD